MTERRNENDRNERGTITYPRAGKPVVFRNTADPGVPPAQGLYDPALDNQDARHPTYYANENRNYYSTNSNWILDGSFLKLRNLQVGYTLPERLAGRLWTERMRVYVTGKNLWTHSNLGIGLDPEYSAVRGDYYPQTRVFSIGTDLSF